MFDIYFPIVLLGTSTLSPIYFVKTFLFFLDISSSHFSVSIVIMAMVMMIMMMIVRKMVIIQLYIPGIVFSILQFSIHLIHAITPGRNPSIFILLVGKLR